MKYVALFVAASAAVGIAVLLCVVVLVVQSLRDWLGEDNGEEVD